MTIVLPLIAGAALAVSAGIKGFDTYRQWRTDSKYWADYYRNTGFRPKYPQKAYYNTAPGIAGAVGSLGGAAYGRSLSSARRSGYDYGYASGYSRGSGRSRYKRRY